MKKLALICGLLASTATFAETKTEPTTEKDNRPMLALRVVDMGTKVPRPLSTRVLSLKEKHQLCWVAFNMPFAQSNKITQVFETPAPAKYAYADGQVVSSKDKKTHTITSSERAVDGRVSTCWAFDHTDPVGQYKLSIQVNDVTFPVQSFEVKK